MPVLSICRENSFSFQPFSGEGRFYTPARGLFCAQEWNSVAFEIDFLESYNRDSIAAELRRVAELLGKNNVSRRDIDRYGRLNSRTVMQKFGTLRHAHEAAGLAPSRYTKATDAELLKIVLDLWTITLAESGRSPLSSEVRKYGFQVSPRTIMSRFGSWNQALLAASSAGAEEVPTMAREPVRVERKSISMRTRFLVFQGDRFQCRICGASGVPLEVDHVVPVSRGGSDAMGNLQTLCGPCNRGKSDSLQ